MRPGEAMELLWQATGMLHAISENKVPNPRIHAAAVLLLAAQMVSRKFDKAAYEKDLASRLEIPRQVLAMTQIRCFNLLHCKG